MGEDGGHLRNHVPNLYSSSWRVSWESYRNLRPTYPTELYDTIAKYMQNHNRSGRDVCIDYGSGAGTAVPGLLRHCAVQKVIATDKNERQLEEAATTLGPVYSQDRFETILGVAGELDMVPDSSVNLVTAAEACHWFDRPKWLREVARVLKPSGTLAFWVYPPQCYIVSHPEANSPCNRAFESFFAANCARTAMPLDPVLVTISLCDCVVVDPHDFVHQERYKWCLPRPVSEKIQGDAILSLTRTTTYTDAEASAGLDAAPDTIMIDDIPETQEGMLLRYTGWTTRHLLSYMSTIGLPDDDILDSEAFKEHIKEIEDIVGGPEGVFDVGWPLALVLATRARNR